MYFSTSIILDNNSTMIKHYISALFLAFSSLIQANDEIKNKIDAILANDQKEAISVFIYDPISMDTIYSKDIYNNLIPASNVKLYTTAAALHLLPNQEYLLTKVYTNDVELEDSVINGNIYLKGFGDALLTTENLDSLVDQLLLMGINKITGDIIADDSYFDNTYTRDDWITDERANVKLPPISGLSLNRNSVIINFNSNLPNGRTPTFTIEPNGNFYNVINYSKVSSARVYPRISYRTELNNINIKIEGSVRKRKSTYGYIVHPDSPSELIANVFKTRLQNKGIEVLGSAVSGATPLSVIELATSRNSFAILVDRVNKRSDNYLAENLFKIIGAEFSNKQGNSFYATQAILSFLDENDIYNEGTVLVDGSGISRFNKTSTASIVSLLEFMYLDINNFDFYFNSLAISGRDGTLENRMYESNAYLNFRGKTGSLNGVSSLSGYLTTKSNRDLIISIIINFKSKGGNYYKSLQDRIISYLAESL
ncbi:MAG: D-alanyl-D-alanine carboxypeptidase/D-alanyl-D-alanine-endopeptidase [Melioribacteraceae bacterium]|nr:D-alanyl-D-alanine carboxypeptidase/D-alanyl-D-alanine-endopeptidase [Melioribacteraceae bacterium]